MVPQVKASSVSAAPKVYRGSSHPRPLLLPGTCTCMGGVCLLFLFLALNKSTGIIFCPAYNIDIIYGTRGPVTPWYQVTNIKM